MLNKANLAIPHALDLSAVAPVWVLGLEKTDLGASYRQAKANLTRIFRGKLAKVLLIGALTLGGGEKLLAEDSIDLSPNTDPDRELFSPESKACITQMSNPLEIPKDRIERFKLYQDWVLTAAKGTTDKIGDSDGVLSVAGLAIEAKEFKNAVLKLIQGVGKTVIGFLGFGSEKDDSNDNSQLEDLYKKALSDLVEEEVDTMLFNDWKRSQSGRRFGGEPRVDAHQLVDQEEAPFFTGINGKILPLCEQELELAMLILLSSEDESFFGHDGADKQVMAGQAVKELAPGKEGRGASSVTMQLIKLLWPKTLNDRFRNSLEGKILQARVAIAFEDSLQETISKQFPNLNKSQVKERAKLVILTVYLNTIHFGVHRDISIEGIEMAARTYYGKSLNQLTIKEIATLVKTIPSPRNQSPAKEQKNLISSSALIKQLPTKIADLDNLPRELELLAEELLADNDNNIPSHWELNSVYRNVIPDTRIQTDLIPQHAEAIWDQVRSILAAQGKTPEQIAEIFRGKITVTLTLNRDAQRAAMEVFAEEIQKYLDKVNNDLPEEEQISARNIQANQLIFDWASGEIRAAVTSNPLSPSSINYLEIPGGQIGSTMKPIIAAYLFDKYQRELEEVAELKQIADELSERSPDSASAQEAIDRYEIAKRLIIPFNLNTRLSNSRQQQGFFTSPVNIPKIEREAYETLLTPFSDQDLGLEKPFPVGHVTPAEELINFLAREGNLSKAEILEREQILSSINPAQTDVFYLDYPFAFEGSNDLWAPTNFSDIFTQEPITVWETIKSSHNLAAADMWMRHLLAADGVTLGGFIDWLNRDLNFPEKEIKKIGSFVLGSGRFSAENLATFYGAVANGGMALQSDWILIKSIKIEGEANPIWEAPPPRFKRVLSPQAAFQIMWALQRACQEGTSSGAWRSYLKTSQYQTCAAKTGTTNNSAALNYAAIIGAGSVSQIFADKGLGSLEGTAGGVTARFAGKLFQRLAEKGVTLDSLLSPPSNYEYDEASRLWIPKRNNEISAENSRGDQNTSLSDINRTVQETNTTAENNLSQSGGILIPKDPMGYQRTPEGILVPAGYTLDPSTKLWVPPGIDWEYSAAETLNRFRESRPFRSFLIRLSEDIKAFKKSREKQISAEENATDPCVVSVDHLAGDVSAEVNSTILGTAEQNRTTEFSAEDLADWQQVDPFCTTRGLIDVVEKWFEEESRRLNSKGEKGIRIPEQINHLLSTFMQFHKDYEPTEVLLSLKNKEIELMQVVISARKLVAFLEEQIESYSPEQYETEGSSIGAIRDIGVWKILHPNSSLPYEFENLLETFHQFNESYSYLEVISKIKSKLENRLPEDSSILLVEQKEPREVGGLIPITAQ